MLRGVVLLVVLVTAASARADVPPPPPPPPPSPTVFQPVPVAPSIAIAARPPALGWQVTVGGASGNLYVDGAATRASGLSVGIGAHYGPFDLVADLAGFGLSPIQRGSMVPGSNAFALDGELIRIGGDVRFRIWRGRGDSARAWLEAGAAHESITWTAGGSLARPDVLLGLGGGLGRRTGIELRVFAVLSKRHDDTSPTCGGPCDMATSPASWDRSFFVELGLAFGR